MSHHHLRLLEGEQIARDAFRSRQFSLALQQQRPGELCETVRPTWRPDQLERGRQHAADAGVPLGLWLTLTVEAERALAEAAELHNLLQNVLATHADQTASLHSVSRVLPIAARRLAEYAAALRVGDDRLRARDERSSVALDVPHTTLAAWALSATATGMRVEEWVGQQELPPGRHMWEAAAAEAGLQLDGWLLRQATRCARSRSTSAHTAA